MARYGRLAEELRDIIDDDASRSDRASLEEDDCGCGNLRGVMDAIDRGRDVDLLKEP